MQGLFQQKLSRRSQVQAKLWPWWMWYLFGGELINFKILKYWFLNNFLKLLLLLNFFFFKFSFFTSLPMSKLFHSHCVLSKVMYWKLLSHRLCSLTTSTPSDIWSLFAKETYKCNTYFRFWHTLYNISNPLHVYILENLFILLFYPLFLDYLITLLQSLLQHNNF